MALKAALGTPNVISADCHDGRQPRSNSTGQKSYRLFNIRFHFIHEVQENGLIQIKYCPTEEMLADLLTKFLPRNSFDIAPISWHGTYVRHFN